MNYSDWLQGIEKLTNDQKFVLYERLKQIIPKQIQTASAIPDSKRISKGSVSYSPKIQAEIKCCPYCGSTAIKKHGKTKSKVQRFICKDCKKTFTDNYNTISYYSHLADWQLLEIIRGIVLGAPIPTIAKNAKLANSTVWEYRLKIYQTIKNIYGYCDTFNSIVEADGKYERLSFKGKKDPSFFVYKLGRLPRSHKSRQQRIDYLEKNGLFKDIFKNYPSRLKEMLYHSQKRMDGVDTIDKNHQHVCILTLVDRGSNLYMEPVTLGVAKAFDVYDHLSDKISDDAILVTDKHFSYRYLAHKNRLNHQIVDPEEHINGTFSLSRVNSVHSEFKKFLLKDLENKPATKYLDLYIMMFWWLWKTKEYDRFKMLSSLITGEIETELRSRMVHVTRKELMSRPLPIDTKGFI